VRDVFLGFTTRFEGRVRWMYLDVKGLVTIGVGNLIDPEGQALGLPFIRKRDRAPASVEEIRSEWRRIKSEQSLARRGYRAAESITELELTDDAIDNLVLGKLDANETTLRRTFPEWAEWPADARLGALSMAWALGAGFPAQYPKFTAAARTRDWTLAAAQCHISEAGNPGVAARNEANFRLFTNAGAVEARGLDPATLCYPSQA
jgi:GH24 family phage-related lysozyme (muramidase)